MENDTELNKGEGKEEGEENQVVLDRDTYEALMDRIADLENAALAKPRVVNLDDLVDEVKPAKPARREEAVSEPGVVRLPANIEDMSNAQLVQYIMETGGGQIREEMQDMRVAIQTVSLVQEIDKCERKHDDFWDYEPEVRKLAMENPSLSIEQAYKLAKANKGDARPSKKDGDDDDTRKPSMTEKILNLPPRRNIQSGEKPGSGVAPNSTKEREDSIRTTRDAASKAWDDVVGKGKTEL